MQKPKVLDLFAGCGGFSLGFHLAGYDVLAHAEIDKACCNTIKLNFKPEFLYEDDIQKDKYVEWIEKLPLIDVIIAGPPCQGFSVAGVSWVTRDRKRGLNNLYLIPIATAEILKPKAVVIENVPAVLATKNIPLVALALFRLQELGYKTYPKPPSIEHLKVEGFYDIAENILSKLNDIGVKSKKNLLSDPDGIYELFENIREFYEKSPSLKSFYEFYNSYWSNISENSFRSQVSKTRLDHPSRISSFFKTHNIEVPMSLLQSVKREINNLTTFLDKNGLLLDNLSFGNPSLMKGYLACQILELPIKLPPKLAIYNFKQLEDLYLKMLRTIQKWGNEIREKTILKSEDYGAPERRHRAFIIAYKNSEVDPSPPLPTFSMEVPLKNVLGDLPALLPGEGTDLMVPYPPVKSKLSNYQLNMRKDSIGVANHRTRTIKDPFYLSRYAMMFQGSNDLSLPFFLQKLKKKQFVDAWRRLDIREPSKVIVAHLKKDGNSFVHPFEERTISVREAARIQGFPDQFIFPLKDNFAKHFQQIGNAVSVQMAEALAKHIGKELRFNLESQTFEGPSENELIKNDTIKSDYITQNSHLFRDLRSNDTYEYIIREFTVKEANFFKMVIEELNIGKAKFNEITKTLSYYNFTLENLDDIEEVLFLPLRKIRSQEIPIELIEIKMSSKSLGYLGKWLYNGKEIWFSFFRPTTPWYIQRSIATIDTFPPIRQFIMMNLSKEFYLKFLGSCFDIVKPLFWNETGKFDKQISVETLDKFIIKQKNTAIKKKKFRFKWDKLGTRILISLTLWYSTEYNLGLRIKAKCNQFNDTFQVEETIISKGAIITDLINNKSRKNDRIIEYERIKSNLMIFFCHYKLFEEKLISEKDMIFYWGENWLQTKS